MDHDTARIRLQAHLGKRGRWAPVGERLAVLRLPEKVEKPELRFERVRLTVEIRFGKQCGGDAGRRRLADVQAFARAGEHRSQTAGECRSDAEGVARASFGETEHAARRRGRAERSKGRGNVPAGIVVRGKKRAAQTAF